MLKVKTWYKTEADRDLCSLVSLGDSEGVGLVLDGLGVDGGAGEGVVGVAEQTQGVDRSFHLENTQNHVENKYFSGHEDNLLQNSHQMFVDNLSCILLSNVFSSELLKSFVSWGEQGEGAVWGEK